MTHRCVNGGIKKDSSCHGQRWVPLEDASVPVIALFPRNTSIIQPDFDNMHALITARDCGIVSVIFWDCRVLAATNTPANPVASGFAHH